jgi:hypothetical protein
MAKRIRATNNTRLTLTAAHTEPTTNGEAGRPADLPRPKNDHDHQTGSNIN